MAAASASSVTRCAGFEGSSARPVDCIGVSIRGPVRWRDASARLDAVRAPLAQGLAGAETSAAMAQTGAPRPVSGAAALCDDDSPHDNTKTRGAASCLHSLDRFGGAPDAVEAAVPVADNITATHSKIGTGVWRSGDGDVDSGGRKWEERDPGRLSCAWSTPFSWPAQRPPPR